MKGSTSTSITALKLHYLNDLIVLLKYILSFIPDHVIAECFEFVMLLIFVKIHNEHQALWCLGSSDFINYVHGLIDWNFIYLFISSHDWSFQVVIHVIFVKIHNEHKALRCLGSSNLLCIANGCAWFTWSKPLFIYLTLVASPIILWCPFGASACLHVVVPCVPLCHLLARM